MRTPKYLIDIARRFPSAATESAPERPLLHDAIAGDAKALETALAREQAAEQERDKEDLAAIAGGAGTTPTCSHLIVA